MDHYEGIDFSALGADRNAPEIRAAASTLLEAGMVVFADGSPIADLSLVTIKDETALSVKLGIGGEITVAGKRAFLIAIDTPAAGTGAHEAFTNEAELASCGNLLKRIRTGWTESLPNGDTRYFLSLHAETKDEFETIIRSIPSRVAELSNAMNVVTIIAQIHFGKSAVVSPTATADGEYSGLEGTRGKPRIITSSELLGLGVVLDQASETRDRHARGWFDVRKHDVNTNKVRDRFNRIQTPSEVQKLITLHGWEVVQDERFSTEYRKGEERGLLVKDTLVFINRGVTAETLAGAAVTYRAFDLLIGLEMAVGKDGHKRPLNSPEDVAVWLADSGQLSAEIEVFKARGAIPVINGRDNTLDIVRSYATVIQAARAHNDAATPLAFRRTVNGAGDGVISIGPSGSPTRWTERNAMTLLIAAAQYAIVTTTKDGEDKVVTSHGVPPAIVHSVLMTLESPNILRPVEYLASEPIISREGQIVSQHGYDMGAHAYLTIPHRDRAKWRNGYHVPTAPTTHDVRTAFENLDRELLSDFPFSEPRDRARAMIYILTCVGRSNTNGSIAFMVNAKDRGSGKSLLLLLGRLLAQGTPRSKSFRFGKIRDEETEKGLVSLLLQGGIFFHCDETPRNKAVTGDVLTGLITAVDGDEELRILGTNDMVTRGGTIVTGAGNQVKLGQDFSRRFLTCNMEYKGKGSVLARAGFRHQNIVDYVKQNRPQLLAWAHTILLHGAQNEPTHTIPNLGMNHDWAQKILGAASHIKVNETQTLDELALDGWLSDVNSGDILGESWGELLEHLWKKANGKPKTASEFARLSINVNAQAGEEKPELPPGLLGVSPKESNAGSRWAAEMGDIDGSRIPHNGIAFILQKIDKNNASRKSLTYSIRCFDAAGDEVLPGRDPYAKPAAPDPAAGLDDEMKFS